MKVCQRLDNGLALCIVTRGDEPIHMGASVLNTCSVGLGLTPYGGVPSVTAGNLELAIRILSSQAPAEARLLETGIKAVDLLCPFPAGGFVAQVGTGGVGRMVLLDELRARLEREPRPSSMLCLVHPSEPGPYRDWEEASWRESAGQLKCYWALSSDGADPSHTGLDACDAILHMSPLLALQGLYPAIDPEYSWSRSLRHGLVGTEHRALAERARAALVWAKWSYADPVALELLARRAPAAAHRRSQAFQPVVNAADQPAFERARKLQLFLSQPFHTAQELTGWPGSSVPLADTLHGTRAILDGEVDHLPTAAFAYASTLDDVREHARLSVSRCFG